MEIRVLKYFLAVAREGSILGASKSLHLTQPTLSRQIKDLEEELGQQLLIRTNHNVSLTPEGILLRKRAEEIISMVDKTKIEFNSLKDTISGEIYIGGGETTVIRYVAEMINEIREDYPDILFHLYSGNLEDVTEKLDKGLLDFGIIMSPADLSKYNALSFPEKDIWGVLMRKDNALAEKYAVPLDDLKGVPLILSQKMYRDYSKNKEFYKWFADNQASLNIVATHNLIFNAAVMAQCGTGCVLTLNDLSANTEQTNNLCFRPLKPAVECSWDLVWKKYQVFSPAAKLFLERMQERFAK